MLFIFSLIVVAGACGQLVIQHGQQAGGCSSEAAGSSSTGGLKDIEELVAAAPAAAR
jgi:preprotein translocase subunit SecG